MIQMIPKARWSRNKLSRNDPFFLRLSGKTIFKLIQVNTVAAILHSWEALT